MGKRLFELVESDKPKVSNAAAIALVSTLSRSNHEAPGDIHRALALLIRFMGRREALGETKVKIFQQLKKCPRLYQALAYSPILKELQGMSVELDSNQVTPFWGLLRQIVKHNPADCLPLVRKRLFECLAEIGQPDENQNRTNWTSQNGEVLVELVLFPSHWIRPYCSAILNCALENIRAGQMVLEVDCLVSSSIAVLSTVAEIDSECVEKHLQSIFDLLCDLVNESHSQQRQTAVMSSLASILRTCDRTLLSPDSLPGLLNSLIELLKVELNPTVRRYLLDLFGVVGSIDPYRMKVPHGFPKRKGSPNEDGY